MSPARKHQLTVLRLRLNAMQRAIADVPGSRAYEARVIRLRSRVTRRLHLSR